MPYLAGADNPNFTGGRNTSSNGYPRIKVGKDHPLTNSNGYVYEHLLVWVSAGNPPPGPDEEIHHINEHKQDNRLANLELIPKRRHSRGHEITKPRDKNGRFQSMEGSDEF